MTDEQVTLAMGQADLAAKVLWLADQIKDSDTEAATAMRKSVVTLMKQTMTELLGEEVV